MLVINPLIGIMLPVIYGFNVQQKGDKRRLLHLSDIPNVYRLGMFQEMFPNLVFIRFKIYDSSQVRDRIYSVRHKFAQT